MCTGTVSLCSVGCDGCAQGQSLSGLGTRRLLTVSAARSRAVERLVDPAHAQIAFMYTSSSSHPRSRNEPNTTFCCRPERQLDMRAVWPQSTSHRRNCSAIHRRSSYSGILSFERGLKGNVLVGQAYAAIVEVDRSEARSSRIKSPCILVISNKHSV